MSVEWFEEALQAAKKHVRGEDRNAHKRWFDEQVEALRSNAGESVEDPAAALRESLGFFSGYYDDKTAQTIYDYYGAEHPFFGTPENRAKLVPMQIFDMAKELGRKEELLAKPKEAEAILEIEQIIVDLREGCSLETANRLQRALSALRLPVLPAEPDRGGGIEVVERDPIVRPS